MKIKEKMVELKNRSVDFVKEHKYDIMEIGLYAAINLAFYSIGRRDGKIERDRDWHETLDGNVVVSDDMMCDWINHTADYYNNGDRNCRYFDMYTVDGEPYDIIKVSDLGNVGSEMIDIYKEKKDISDERVTHMMIITDPETGN